MFVDFGALFMDPNKTTCNSRDYIASENKDHGVFGYLFWDPIYETYI